MVDIGGGCAAMPASAAVSSEDLSPDRLPAPTARTTEPSFSKVRWQGRERSPYVLDFEPETESFTFIKEEEGEERDYAVEIENFLKDNPLRTSREIGKAIGAAREKADEVLKAHPDRFDSVTGEAAKAAGRKPMAVLWLLASPQKPEEPEGRFRGES